jgi:hypothetical protein
MTMRIKEIDDALVPIVDIFYRDSWNTSKNYNIYRLAEQAVEHNSYYGSQAAVDVNQAIVLYLQSLLSCMDTGADQ